MSSLRQSAGMGLHLQDGNLQSLIDLFTHQFRVDRPLYANGSGGRSVRSAIRWLSQAVGRPATVADLTRNAVDRMRRLTDCGLSKVQAGKIYKGICALWTYAHSLGLVDEFDPPDRFVVKRPPPHPRRTVWKIPPINVSFTVEVNGALEQEITPSQTTSAQVGGSIALYALLERQFFVAFPRWRERHDYATQLRRSIEWFTIAVGHEATTADLTGENFDAFRNLLSARANQVSQSTQQWLCERLCKIWKFAAREGLVNRFDPPRRPSARAAAIDLPEPENGTVREFFESAYRPQRLFGRTAKMIGDYRRVLRFLRHHYDRDVRLPELNDALAAEHFEWLLSQGFSSCTVNNQRAMLFAIWRLAAEQGFIDRTPRVRKLRAVRPEIDVWTVEEVSRIVEAAAKFRPDYYCGPVPAGAMYRALLLVGWWTGLRISSLLSIRWSDVDLNTGWIRIRPEFTKNRRPARKRVGPDAISALLEIRAPDREKVFPVTFADTTLDKHFREILHVAGIAPSARKTLNLFHKLRRSIATKVANVAGLGAAKALLDHSDEAVTRLYVDGSESYGADATKLLPAPLMSTNATPGRQEAQKAAFHLARGDYAEACFMGRLALEVYLRSKARGLKRCPAGKVGIGVFADFLAGQRVISRQDQKAIAHMARKLSGTCHTGRINPDIASKLIDGVQSIVLRSNSNTEDQ